MVDEALGAPGVSAMNARRAMAELGLEWNDGAPDGVSDCGIASDITGADNRPVYPLIMRSGWPDGFAQVYLRSGVWSEWVPREWIVDQLVPRVRAAYEAG